MNFIIPQIYHEHGFVDGYQSTAHREKTPLLPPQESFKLLKTKDAQRRWNGQRNEVQGQRVGTNHAPDGFTKPGVAQPSP
jgi:hypothetical protein